jgi:histidinol-phosphate aminotransferase
MEALQNSQQVNEWVSRIVEQKELLIKELSNISFVQKVYESDANFLLVKIDDANSLYHYLSSHKIIVRNRSKEVMCDNCLRITIGTPAENQILLKVLKNYSS